MLYHPPHNPREVPMGTPATGRGPSTSTGGLPKSEAVLTGAPFSPAGPGGP
jgi:hypothetical protein